MITLGHHGGALYFWGQGRTFLHRANLFFYVKPVRKVRLRHTASISRLLYGEEPHGTGTSGIVKKDQEFGSSSGTSITSTSFSIGCLTQTEKKTITKSTECGRGGGGGRQLVASVASVVEPVKS